MQRFLLALVTVLGALTASAQVAVNPVTNRIYVANEFANSVSVIDGATGATVATVPVGNRPQFIALNPLNNRIYVDNGSDASLSVIEGADNTVQTLPIGSTGPIAINPVTGKVYVVRLTTAATDEVTVVDEAALSWYTMATNSFQPVAIAVNPVSNVIYVAHYASGHVRAIDGSSTSDHPPSVEIGVWSKPVAVTVNPVTGRAYSLQEDDRGPIAVITPDNEATFLTAPAGHAVGPKAVAVNPVTNKIYAAFSNEVIVVDGASLAMTFIPSPGPVALGINTATNKIYVPNADGTLTIIDGATNATSSTPITSNATGIAVNPVTNRYYVLGSDVSIVAGGAGDARQPNPIATTITPLPGDAGDANPTITLDAASGFSPATPQLLAVYYQLDGTEGAWTRASGSGPYSASFTGLSNGSHTLRAFAVDAQVAPSIVTQQQNTPLVGNITAYTFTVGDSTPPPSTIQLSQAAYSVTEGGPQVTVEASRTGGSTGAVSVTWTTVEGTAHAGSDYGVASSGEQETGTLTWADGDTNPKPITLGIGAAVRIIDDALAEPAKAFTITLANPSPGAQLGSPSAATITIEDDDTGAPPTTFRLGAASLSVSETGPNVTLEVIRDGPTDLAGSVNFSTADGTAVNRSDYGTASGVLSFAAGQASKTITIGPSRVAAPYIGVYNDRTAEPSETFSVNLSSPSGGELGTPASATITITGEAPAAGTLQFSAATAGVAENAGSLTLSIVRSGDATSAASVNWTTADGTAVAGTDFGAAGVPSQLAGNVSWAAGESGTRTVSIPILDDAAVDGAKVFTVSLSGASGATLGPASTASVTINDNDAPPAGVAFASTAYSVSESGSTVTLSVNRTGDSRAAASVRWSAINGTALAGRDYGTSGTTVPPSGMVSWRAGDSAPKPITIRVLADAVSEGDLQFTVQLSAASGTAIASPDSTTVTITDDDFPPESTFNMSQAKYLAMENGGEVSITVNREALAGGGFTRAASVAFGTVAGTALAGSDFSTRNGTLTWGAGESGAKTFSVFIANDTIPESPEAFVVRLSSPSAGASITNGEATVLIVDDDEGFPVLGAFPDGWTVPPGAAGGWFVSNEAGAFEGAYSLRSDAVGDGEAAQVEVARTFAAGTVSFRLRVSSEASFDFLRFYVDGLKVGEWSGTANTAWQAFSTPITAGAHTLRWSYEKDASASLGADAAWIDAVALPAAP